MTTPVDKVKLKKIIQEGDPVELVNCANEFGTALANDRVSKSQIRNAKCAISMSVGASQSVAKSPNQKRLQPTKKTPSAICGACCY